MVKSHKNKKNSFIILFLAISIIATIVFYLIIIKSSTLEKNIFKSNYFPNLNSEISNIYYVQSSDGKTVPIPKGYSASKIEGETEVQKGFVIYEGNINWEEQQNLINNPESEKAILNLQSTYNQYVWIPIDEEYLETIYGADSTGKLWGKQYTYSNEGRTPKDWFMYNNKIVLNSSTNYFEPDLGLGANTTIVSEYILKTLLNKTRATLVVELEQLFYETIKSIKTYGGFYVGRYETGIEDNKPVIKRMNNNLGNQTWAEMYQKTQEMKEEKDYITTSLIWSSLWDYIMQWFINTGEKTNETITFSEEWGNYANSQLQYYLDKEANISTKTPEDENSIPIPSGSSENTKVNNIYDMAGNVNELTLGCYSYNFSYRGGAYDSNTELETSCAYRNYQQIATRSETTGSRAIMLLKSFENKGTLEKEQEKNQSIEENNFILYKQDGETYEPIEGTKFIITNLENNHTYELITGKNGKIETNLPRGIYKAVEIEANEEYVLEELEENRTYYFEIGLSDIDIAEWIRGVNGYSWNSIKSITSNQQNEIIAVGEISEYSPDIVDGSYDGVDLNLDGKIDEISRGSQDGIIIAYDVKGNYLWSKTIGGNDADSCNQIIKTKDGGYIVIGYTVSKTVYLGEKLIEELSSTNENLKNKDGYVLKLDSKGEYEWGIRIGGILEDEISKVIENTKQEIIIIGNFNSTTLNFYEKTNLNEPVEKIYNSGKQNSFIANYSKDGKYNWSKKIGGNDYCQITDITETEENISIIANYKGTLEIKENKTISTEDLKNQNGIILNYTDKGNLNWYYEVYSPIIDSSFDYGYVRLNGITTTKENNLAITMECTNTVKSKSNQNEDIIYTCQGTGINASIFLISTNGEFLKNIYGLNGTIGTFSTNSATVVFQDIISTENNTLIVGGYYNSEQSIDVDKDGSKTGRYDFKNSIKKTSNGCVLEIDLEGNVKFSDCMYRKNRNSYSPSNITCVQELNKEKIVAGGTFYWETITTQKFYTQTSGKTENYINRIGNKDGFLFLENRNYDILEETETINLTINNFKKKDTSTEIPMEIYELPVTGSISILWIDFISTIIIILGILKIKKN